MEPEEVLEQEVDTEVEQVSEQPTQQVEPMQINTHGQWETFGKTYRITVKGHCQFAVSAEKPTAGIATTC